MHFSRSIPIFKEQIRILKMGKSMSCTIASKEAITSVYTFKLCDSRICYSILTQWLIHVPPDGVFMVLTKTTVINLSSIR